MGIYYQAYLGPYVACTVNDKIAATTNQYEIDSGKLRIPGGGDAAAAANWMDKHNIHIWMPNVKIPAIQRELSNQYFMFCDVTPDLINTEKLHFFEFFKKEILRLDDNYGGEQVKIEWGLLYYGS